MSLQGPEEAPLGELEAIAGELLPELLSQQPLQLWQQDSQTKLLAALKKLAIAVLRCRYRSPKHLSLLTGLLASLLHGESHSCTRLVQHYGSARPIKQRSL